MFKTLFSIFAEKKDLLHQALEDANRMMRIAQDIFHKSSAPLFEGGTPVKDEIYKSDQSINQLVIEIRRKVLEHLSVMPQQDTTAALVLTIITVDIERIGDYCKNFFELWELYPRKLDDEPPFNELADVYRTIKQMFEDTAVAFERGDAEVGRKVMETHVKNAHICEAIVSSIVHGDEKWKKLTEQEDVMAVLIARYLKRVSAHLKNIASSVVNPFDRISFRPDEPGKTCR